MNKVLSTISAIVLLTSASAADEQSPAYQFGMASAAIALCQDLSDLVDGNDMLKLGYRIMAAEHEDDPDFKIGYREWKRLDEIAHEELCDLALKNVAAKALED